MTERELTRIEELRPDLTVMCSRIRYARRLWTRQEREKALLEALMTAPAGTITRDGARHLETPATV